MVSLCLPFWRGLACRIFRNPDKLSRELVFCEKHRNSALDHGQHFEVKMEGLMTTTPRERVLNRLAGKAVDRIPNLSILMTFAARYIGQPYDRYVQDHRVLVEGNLRCCEDFGIDMLSAISDPVRETYDLGAEIVFPLDDVPYAAQPLVREPADLQRLKLVNPVEGKRMLDRIEAIALYRQKAGQQYPILGWVEGAFAEACDLHGISETMEDLYNRPAFMADLLEFCTQQAVWFAEVQIDAGADFIGIGDAAASLIGPRLYRKFCLPYEQRIIAAIHAHGAKAKLHICGNITALLRTLPETQADMIDVDYPVEFSSAVEAFGSNISACGNFEPSGIVMQGSAADVMQAVKDCVRVSGANTCIAPGCEVPRDTPLENMHVISQTLREIAAQQDCPDAGSIGVQDTVVVDVNVNRGCISEKNMLH
jgi:uroporphyrinogen decarboxylase